MSSNNGVNHNYVGFYNKSVINERFYDEFRSCMSDGTIAQQ